MAGKFTKKYNPAGPAGVQRSERSRKVQAMITKEASAERQARVYCPICLHLVEAAARQTESVRQVKLEVIKGQHCGRCGALLDAACVVDVVEAPARQAIALVKPKPAARLRARRQKRIAA